MPDGAMIAPMEMESPQCARPCADGLAMDSGTEQCYVKENGLLKKNKIFLLRKCFCVVSA